jgi:transcriptional regulator with XRE-family HTH domain
MGTSKRRKPVLLAEKLLTIRTGLGLSQNGMIRRMGLAEELTQAEVSMYERGIRVPPLPFLLEYAQAANVYVDVLIDDSLKLPAKLPPREKHQGVRVNKSPIKVKRGNG